MISTVHPLAMNTSDTCEPINPAPPVTNTRLLIRVLATADRERRRRRPRVLQAKQVPRGVDDAQPTPIGGRGAQAHARLMQEFVHEFP